MRQGIFESKWELVEQYLDKVSEIRQKLMVDVVSILNAEYLSVRLSPDASSSRCFLSH